MRVLHVWNTAGVGSVIAKYMDRLFQTESTVVMRKEFDRYGLTIYGELWNCGAYVFTAKALWKARKYDLIHVHDFDKVVPLMKRFYPTKPVILHYHGTRIRGKSKERFRYYRKADLIIVSTSDLLEDLPEATYLPNPVDTDFFKPLEGHSDNSALYVIKQQEELGENFEWPKGLARKYGLQLSFRDRIDNPIPYKELSIFLNRYSYLLDRDYIKSLSKTALEALACGLKVVAWNGKIVEGLPKKHEPENVTKQFYTLYKKLKRTN